MVDLKNEAPDGFAGRGFMLCVERSLCYSGFVYV